MIILVTVFLVPWRGYWEGLRGYQEVERRVSETLLFLDKHTLWDEEATKKLQEKLDELEGETLSSVKQVIEKLSERLQEVLGSSKNRRLLENIYRRAQAGKQVERRAITRAVLGYATSTQNVRYMYDYKSILGWPTAFKEAIDYLSATGDSEPNKSMIKIWRAYLEIIKSDHNLTIGEAKEKFSSLRQCLEPKAELAEHLDPNSLVHLRDMYRLYDHIWAWLCQPENKHVKIEPLEGFRLAYLQRVYDRVKTITDAGFNPSSNFGAIKSNLMNDWKRGNFSYVDYLALCALIEKSLPGASKGG